METHAQDVLAVLADFPSPVADLAEEEAPAHLLAVADLGPVPAHLPAVEPEGLGLESAHFRAVAEPADLPDPLANQVEAS